MLIRDASFEDWAAIWRIQQPIIAAGETFCWDTTTSESQAHAMWMHPAPGRTFVAVDDDGTILGTAESHPNFQGPGTHIANAGFMVSVSNSGRGVGRALAEHTLDQARWDGFRAMQFNAVAESNVGAVALWRSLGFEILTTVPEGFRHPTKGFVGLHIMHRWL